VCLCVCLSLAAFPHYCTDPDVTWRIVGVPLVVHYWADLQSVHGFHCCDNIAAKTICQRVLVLALCLVSLFFAYCMNDLYLKEPSHGGMQSSIFLCLSQARINREDCDRKGIQRKNGGIDGGGLLIGPDGVAPTRIVSVSASCYPP